MDSTRQQKIGRMMQKEISELFQLEGKNYYGNAFVTVTGVRVTPDLGVAYVRLSLFKEKDAQKIIDSMNLHMHDIRRKLGNRIRNQVRHIPELKFFNDDSLDYVDQMEKIFRQIHKDDKQNEA
jgi:ribosome-binding factor A